MVFSPPGTLPRRIRKELLAVKLRNRPSKQELEDRNIFPVRSDQERQEIRQQIEMKLAKWVSLCGPSALMPLQNTATALSFLCCCVPLCVFLYLHVNKHNPHTWSSYCSHICKGLFSTMSFLYCLSIKMISWWVGDGHLCIFHLHCLSPSTNDSALSAGFSLVWNLRQLFLIGTMLLTDCQVVYRQALEKRHKATWASERNQTHRRKKKCFYKRKCIWYIWPKSTGKSWADLFSLILTWRGVGSSSVLRRCVNVVLDFVAGFMLAPLHSMLRCKASRHSDGKTWKDKTAILFLKEAVLVVAVFLYYLKCY